MCSSSTGVSWTDPSHCPTPAPPSSPASTSYQYYAAIPYHSPLPLSSKSPSPPAFYPSPAAIWAIRAESTMWRERGSRAVRRPAGGRASHGGAMRCPLCSCSWGRRGRGNRCRRRCANCPQLVQLRGRNRWRQHWRRWSQGRRAGRRRVRTRGRMRLKCLETEEKCRMSWAKNSTLYLERYTNHSNFWNEIDGTKSELV